jgi:nucleoside-diphosphate-sugar epimerase
MSNPVLADRHRFTHRVYLLRFVLLSMLDATLWLAALSVAVNARLGFSWALVDIPALLIVAFVAIDIHLLTGIIAGLYTGRRRLASFEETVWLAVAATAGTTAAFLVSWLAGEANLVPLSAVLAAGAYQLIGALGVRYAGRLILDLHRPRAPRNSRMLIFGAGEAGLQTARTLMRDPQAGGLPVAFLDDDPSKAGLRTQGLRVVGSRKNIGEAAVSLKADTMVIAMPSASYEALADVADRGREAGLTVRVLPRLSQIVEEGIRVRNTRDKIADILVIGGAGYIGSHLTRQLLASGYRVHILDSFMYGRQGLVGLESDPRLFVTKADSRDIAAVTEAMRQVDAVVHLGEIVGDPACAVDEQLTLEVNLIATRVIAEIAKGYGITRFVYASSCSVYGATSEIVSEQSDLKPVSLYARAKIASEDALFRLADERFKPTVLRFSTVYGWSYRPRYDLVVNLLSAQAVQTGNITVFGGTQWRPFVHVEDAARAIEVMLESPLDIVGTQVFNVGSDGENYSLQQLAGIIQSVVPSVVVDYEGNKVDDRSYRVSFSKLQSLTGFEPQWNVENGVRQMVEQIQTGDAGSFREDVYSNYLTFSDPSALAEAKAVDSVARMIWLPEADVAKTADVPAPK